VRRGEALEGVQRTVGRVEEDEVGEGAADVDADAHGEEGGLGDW
jgi:hypothetical protein